MVLSRRAPWPLRATILMLQPDASRRRAIASPPTPISAPFLAAVI